MTKHSDSKSLIKLINHLVSSHDIFAHKLINVYLSGVEVDEKVGKSFLKHEYNRDGDSYRSPFSNQYYPPADCTFFPSE